MKTLLYSYSIFPLICFFTAFSQISERNIPFFSNHKKIIAEYTMDCFNEKNFELAYRYTLWELKQTAKISVHQRVIIGNAEVDIFEDEQNVFLQFWKNNSLYAKFEAKKGIVPIFKSQKKSYVNVCNKLFCELLELAKQENLPENYAYDYADGSGNTWKITDKTMRYEPVSPENSSSGIYSGGIAFEVSITQAQFEVIEQLMLEGLQNSSEHSEKRTMGTGSIRQFIRTTIIKKCYLNLNSTQKEAVEKYLNSLVP